MMGTHWRRLPCVFLSCLCSYILGPVVPGKITTSQRADSGGSTASLPSTTSQTLTTSTPGTSTGTHSTAAPVPVNPGKGKPSAGDREFVRRTMDFTSPLFKPQIGFPLGSFLLDSLYEYETLYDDYNTLVQKVESSINMLTKTGNYKARWMLKITRVHVPAYPARVTIGTNTYQAILSTNGSRSYALFLYQSGGMRWNVTGRPGNPVLIGFSSGDGYFKNGQLTFHPVWEKYRPDQFLDSNTGLQGLWIYELYREVKPNYRFRCLQCLKREPQWPSWGWNQISCPCSWNQGVLDLRFQSISRAWMVGDPHITTLDGVNYTFNGPGDFLLVRTQDRNSSFLLQGRTAQTRSANATNFIGFAADYRSSSLHPITVQWLLKPNNTIHVQLNNQTNGEDAKDQEIFNSSGVIMTHYGSTVSASFNGAVAVSVLASSNILHICDLSKGYQNHTEGLMGFWNGNPDDDFRMPNGSTIPKRSSEEMLFHYGMTWKINGTSLFGKRDDNLPSSFTPVFLSQLLQNTSLNKNLTSSCHGDDQCIFDVLATGSENLGNDTREIFRLYQQMNTTLNQYPPSIKGPDVIKAYMGQTTVVNYTSNAKDITFTLRENCTDFKLFALEKPFLCQNESCPENYCYNNGLCSVSHTLGCQPVCTCPAAFTDTCCFLAGNNFTPTVHRELPLRIIQLSLIEDENASQADVNASVAYRLKNLEVWAFLWNRQVDQTKPSTAPASGSSLHHWNVISEFQYHPKGPVIDFLNNRLLDAVVKMFLPPAPQMRGKRSGGPRNNVAFHSISRKDVYSVMTLNVSMLATYFQCNGYKDYHLVYSPQDGFTCVSPCSQGYCKHGSQCQHLPDGPRCSCVPSSIYTPWGKRCEQLSIKFRAFFGILFGTLGAVLLLGVAVFVVLRFWGRS
ncbi:hypothetical protein G4228_012470 [Cervus hanglu yarkandensis]|nr:hypothetical protein G4228_012470 [Cervus hanglu yarkandensis]